MSSSGSSSLSLDHIPPSEHLCYAQCNFCDTVLAVCVPSSSLYKTVTVRCGHCSNNLAATLRPLTLPSPATNHHQHHLAHNLFSPSSHNFIVGEMPSSGSNYAAFTHSSGNGATNYMSTTTSSSRGGANELPRPPTTNRPPEKRQRVPSAYNRFIKDEIQRIKAGNPDISHREAFSAAAKNWAHFPHIHFGLMPDQTVKRTSNMRPHHPQETGDNVRKKDGFFAASAKLGVSPY